MDGKITYAIYPFPAVDMGNYNYEMPGFRDCPLRMKCYDGGGIYVS